MKLYLLKYNNYYNRIVKKLDTIAEYLTEVGENNYTAQDNISFNPADGVNTSQIYNQIGDSYDYAILTTVENTKEIIKSRWFIIEAERTRTGQYNLKLRRDLVADNLEEIKSAPMFIEKATVGLNDSAIFNSENIDFNEIKTKETLLKDATGSAWIALYFAQGLNSSISGNITIAGDADIDLTTTTHTSWQYYNLNKSVKPDSINVGTLVASRPFGILGAYSGNYLYVNRTDRWLGDEAVSNDKIGYIPNSEKTKDAEALRNSIKTTTFDYSNIIEQLNTENQWLADNDVEKYNNKTIAFSDGVYLCKITKTIEEFSKRSMETNGLSTEVADLLDASAKLAFNSTGVKYTGPFKHAFWIRTNLVHYNVQLIEQSGKAISYEYNIPAEHDRTEDQPYDIVLLPYDDITVKIDDTWVGKTALQNVSLLVAKDIIEKNKGSNKLIDAQIVPYFAEPNEIVNNPIHPEIKLNLPDSGAENKKFNIIKGPDNSFVSFFWYVKKASFTNKITAKCGNTNIAWPVPTLAGLTDIDIKTVIETEKLRICSPNYNGVFEFQPVKAGIDSDEITFSVDCTYMPQTPYIHINPEFNGRLYGADFDDARGLICGGDFSIAQSSDQWETYKAQNKNFQIAFNRQIENIEVNNSVQRTQELATLPINALQSGIRGGFAGSQFGGGAGAAIGGAVAAGASAVAGAVDVMLADKLRKESLDFTKDQFGYQLGNIKALPDSLVKLPAQVYNNKIWPFVEYYTCTNEEKMALKNKIRYNGMTIMRIGTINDFIRQEESYIKGKLIRTDLIKADSHEVMELAAELNQGIFIKE